MLVLALDSHASHTVYVIVQKAGVAAVTHVLFGSGGAVLQPGLPLHSGHWQSHVMVLFVAKQSTHCAQVIVQVVGIATCRQDGVGGPLTVTQPGVPLMAGHVVGGGDVDEPLDELVVSLLVGSVDVDVDVSEVDAVDVSVVF